MIVIKFWYHDYSVRTLRTLIASLEYIWKLGFPVELSNEYTSYLNLAVQKYHEGNTTFK